MSVLCLSFFAYDLKSTRRLFLKYSQTSVFEHDSFWKAVQKPICSKTESYFPITNNVKEINSFHVPKE